jgi:hypothetical protein
MSRQPGTLTGWSVTVVKDSGELLAACEEPVSAAAARAGGRPVFPVLAVDGVPVPKIPALVPEGIILRATTLRDSDWGSAVAC